MAYHPNIPGYEPLYIQTKHDSLAVDIMTRFGVIVQKHDFPIQMKPKEPYKNEWHDEHGDDEYVGDTLFMESFTFSEKCVMITKEADSPTSRQLLSEQVTAFKNYLMNGGEFKLFDSWTKVGFQRVRVSEIPAISDGDYDIYNGKSRVMFTVTFKVNDPVTRMTMSSGKIVTA